MISTRLGPTAMFGPLTRALIRGAQPKKRLVGLLSVETHRRAVTGNTKSREVARALAGTAPSSTARNSVTRPEIPWKAGRAT